MATSYGTASEEDPVYAANMIANPSLAPGGGAIDTAEITKALLAWTIHEVASAIADRRASSARTRCARLDIVSAMPSPLLTACGLNLPPTSAPSLRHFMNRLA